MTNKTTDKIRVMLENMKRKDDLTSNYTIISIEYHTTDFLKNNISVSKWFQKLTNSKSKTGGMMNREWFKKIQNGFYKYEGDNEVLNLLVVFESSSELNRIDLITRIRKIKPLPKYYEVGVQDCGMLENHFNDLFESSSGIEVFGNIKKDDVTTFTSIINSNS